MACGMVVEKNGEAAQHGRRRRGARLAARTAWPGWPTRCARFGVALAAGEVILSGALVPLEPVRPGDRMRLSSEGLGGAEVSFV